MNQWKQFSTILPSGLNSRLADQMKVVGILASKLTKEDTIIFLGDLIDSYAESLSKVIYSAAFHTIKTWASRCKHVYLIVGNHDVYRLVNVLASFDEIPNVTVVDKTITRETEGQVIDMVPWERKLPKTKGDILAAHLMPIGALLGIYSTKRADEGINIEDLDGYKCAIFGHAHEPQTLFLKDSTTEVLCPGSIMQINLSSSSADRYLLRIENDEMSKILIPSPKINTYLITSQKDVDTFLSHDHEYCKLLVQDINIKLPKFDHTVVVEYDVKPTAGKDIENIKELDLLDTIHEFVDNSKTTIDKVVAKELIDKLWT